MNILTTFVSVPTYRLPTLIMASSKSCKRNSLRLAKIYFP